MSDLFGNHIVDFSTRWLKYHLVGNVALVCFYVPVNNLPVMSRRGQNREAPVRLKYYKKVQVGNDQEKRNQKKIPTPKTEAGKNQNNNMKTFRKPNEQ